jgi:hypothetical protein
MVESDTLTRIQARRYLEDVNQYILEGDGEIIEVPGKLSLVWTGAAQGLRSFISVKAAGDDSILVNGRLYPATEPGLQQALRTCLADRK